MVHHAVFSKEYLAVPGTPVSRADPSGRPAPDPNTISHHGIIQVINAASGTVLGYISDSSMKRAQLRYQPGTDSALKVSFKTDKTGSGTNLNLVMKVWFELAPVDNFFSP